MIHRIALLLLLVLLPAFPTARLRAQSTEESSVHLLPLAVLGNGWDTGITVVNTGSQALKIARLVLYGADGSSRTLSCSGCLIPARGRFSRLLSEFVKDAANGTLEITIAGAGARQALCYQGLYSGDARQFDVLAAKDLSTQSVMDLETAKQVAAASVHTAAVGLAAAMKALPTTQERISLIRTFIDPIRFNPDRLGYFYVYDYNCISIAHATQKDLVGQDLSNYQDTKGKYVIRELALAARNGGGYVEFYWVKPGATGEYRKLGYVEPIPETPYFIGSGVYLPE